MTRERIEDMREVVLPFVKKRLLETNYEGLGEADAKEFAREFNEILNLAIKALEQEPILDKIKSDIAKFADTIPFVSGDIKAKYTNIGQHDGLEQALEIIEGNLKGDFDIDEWMAESE